MKAKHDVIPPFEQRNNELVVGGLTTTQIKQMLGSTPFYAYDRKLLSDKVTQLKSALPESISLHYAVKANPYPPLVNFMKPLVDGFDVASKKEMLLAIQSGMPPEEISFAGPGKTEDDISASIIAGITLHAESATEISRATKLGKSLGIKPNIAIRVNPAFELKASGMKMAGGAKPFGIDQELLPDIIGQMDFDSVKFRGFHIFAGSQNLNIDAIIEMHQKTFALAEELVAMTPVNIDYVNIGGGLGIPYFPGEKRIQLEEISDNLAQLIARHKGLAGIELIMELGRYFVGEAGVYICEVVDIKESRGTQYAVCDGGLHHHLSNSGNFGQVIRKNYPVAVANKLEVEEEHLTKTNVVGPLCTPLDIIADKMMLPTIEIGDLIAVFQSGAYGASASPQNFLSQPELKEILL
ncbi:pyridoxal-dependent decarboxylase, exosortase A system-associated [Thalassotalea euphylliae]|uniref:pyridoxal-dependent decarboxylase, exosortase A system-associated n=1 Tax=Thalassotalea euphylliae TaxID=1655234 RepID=UPI003630C351